MGAQMSTPLKTLEHHGTMVARGLSENFNWAPIKSLIANVIFPVFFFIEFNIANWKKLHPLSETLESLTIMGPN